MTDVLAVTTGRGAWPNNGTGGTLSVKGDKPGGYYRAPAAGRPMPGRLAFDAMRAGKAPTLNDYAVFMGVKAIQQRLGATDDGLFGPNTGKAVAAWQTSKGLVADGVFGPASGKAMFGPLATSAAVAVSTRAGFADVVRGHIGHESWWDPGAVGVSTPDDVGLGQINGPAHPTITLEQRFDAEFAIPWIAEFADGNITAMGGVRDDGVAAYNLGIGGARSWVKAGRPQMWGSTDVRKYIASVLTAGSE